MTFDETPVRLPSAPRALDLGAAGRPRDGRYLGRILDVSTRRWDGRGPIAPRRRQRKAWFYAAAFTSRFQVGFAIVDAGFLSTAFAYVYDCDRGAFTEEKAVLPVGFPHGFAPGLDADWRFERGRRRWSITPKDDGWSVLFTGPELRIGVRISDDQPGITAISTPPGQLFHHTYKSCSLNCALDVSVNGERFEESGRSSIDFSVGYPPRDTRWNWASLSGTTADGRLFAANLVAHFMNGLENAMWLDGALYPLSQSVFSYKPDHTLAPWRIVTVDGVVDIEFVPDGERSENLRGGVVASVFTQPFGRFSGKLRQGNKLVSVSGRGVTEQHRALW